MANESVKAYSMEKSFEVMTSLYDGVIYYDECLGEHLVIDDVTEFNTAESMFENLTGAFEMVVNVNKEFIDVLKVSPYIITHKGVTRTSNMFTPELVDYLGKRATVFEKAIYAYLTVNPTNSIITELSDSEGSTKMRVKIHSSERLPTATARPLLTSENIEYILVGKKSYKSVKKEGNSADKKITL